MPSSTFRHFAGGSGAPIQSIVFPPSYRPDNVVIHPWSPQAIGDELNSGGMTSLFTASGYPAASRVIAYPFVIGEAYLVRKVFWLNGGTATTDSADVGVYDEAGTTLIVSAGSTAIAGANVVQEKDVTDTLIYPGRYWCAYVQGGTTATPTAMGGVSRATGVAQMAGSGSTLGATFTPAAMAANFIPFCGIAARTQVA